MTYTVVLSIFEIVIYRSFRIFTWDLGIFNQALWNTLHGRLLYYTAEPYYTTTGCFLAAHFSPILLLLIPFYAICPTAETLLVISTLLIAIGALPAYAIANFFLKNEKIAVVLGILYLLYPPLQGVTLSGFSLESFSGTLFLFILYYLLKADFKKLALVLPLGLMTHEASIPVIAFIGVYGMLFYRSAKGKGLQASVIILGISTLYFFVAQYMRIFFGFTGRSSLWHEWAIIGANSTSDLPLRILLNPIAALNALTFDWTAKLLYVTFILLPFLFLPLLGLRGLIPAFPYLFISLTSSYRLYYSLEGHYAAFISPFIFLGFLHGLTRLQKHSLFKMSVSKLVKLALLLTATLLIVLLPPLYAQYQVFNLDWKKNNIIENAISRVPQNASILTQSNIFPHVSSRPNTYTIAPPIWSAEYERVDKEILQNLGKLNIEYVLLDFSAEQSYFSAAYLIYTDFIIPNADRYSIVYAKEGVVLFHLNA